MQNISPRIAYLGGWAQDEAALKPLAESLDCECMLITLTALFGNSSPGEEKETSAYARNLISRLETLSEPVTLIGWSMGGTVSLEAAIVRPDLFRRLILVSSTCCFCTAPGYTAGVPSALLRSMIPMLRAAPQKLFSVFYQRMYSETKPGNWPRSKIERSLALNGEILLDGLKYLHRTDLRKEVESLQIPTLLIHTRQDKVIPWQASEYLHSKMGQSRLVILEKGDHALAELSPAAISPAIASFVSSS